MNYCRTFFAAVALLAALECPIQAAHDAPSLTNVKLVNDQAFITWQGGRPTFQVQMRMGVDEPWRNIGNPTTEQTATLPSMEKLAFFRIVSDFTARFQMTFQATWSQATHPTNWPSSAHWSGLVGGTHNAAVHFWRAGETASEGIRLMAERGQQGTLLSEIAPALTGGFAQMQLAGGGIGTSPGSVTLTFPQAMTRNYPLVTIVSMIAPSPDWFTGVDSLSLISEGAWVSNITVPVYGYDAGTDSGTTYLSPDQVTAPRGIITRFEGFPALRDGVIVPFGTFVFTRLD